MDDEDEDEDTQQLPAEDLAGPRRQGGASLRAGGALVKDTQQEVGSGKPCDCFKEAAWLVQAKSKAMEGRICKRGCPIHTACSPEPVRLLGDVTPPCYPPTPSPPLCSNREEPLGAALMQPGCRLPIGEMPQES